MGCFGKTGFERAAEKVRQKGQYNKISRRGEKLHPTRMRTWIVADTEAQIFAEGGTRTLADGDADLRR